MKAFDLVYVGRSFPVYHSFDFLGIYRDAFFRDYVFEEINPFEPNFALGEFSIESLLSKLL
jgi:hypothetical protein